MFTSSAGAPEKFITVDGVCKINPAWKTWNDRQQNQTAASSTALIVPQMPNIATALPVVTSVADQQRHLRGAQHSESIETAVEMYHDPDVISAIGIGGDGALAGVAQVFAKYEVPMGLINKLMGISDFQVMEFIVDDSGSMNAPTDSLHPNGQPMTRWQEVHQRASQMFEVLVYVPCPPIYVRFLNRTDVIELSRKPGENPQAFLQRILQTIAPVFARHPGGGTPARERIAESIARARTRSTITYFFGDGQPNDGAADAKEITKMLITRPNPARHPFTFMSCTDEDDACEWMRECEEAAPYCSEFDDYADEQREVLLDQGKAFPFSYGMWLIARICAAFNIFDLDQIDESVPMTKTTIDNLQGYQCTPQEYQYYFNSFLEAQMVKPVKTTLDKVKKDYAPHWRSNYQSFVQSPMAHTIPVVQAYQKAVTELKLAGV